MRRLHSSGGGLLVAAWIAFQPLAGAPADTTKVPLLAIWEHDSDAALEPATPRLAIYQDGTVIAQRNPPRSGSSAGNRAAGEQFVTRTLPTAEINTWYDDIFALVQDEDLKSRYRLHEGGSGPAVTFFFQAGAHGILVTVDGLSPDALSPFGALLKPPAEDVPARLLRIYQDTRRVNLTGAAAWKPQRLEVRRPILPGEESWRRPIIAESDAARAAHDALARSQLGAERAQVRSALQERIAVPAAQATPAQPQPVVTPLELPPLDRAEPKLLPLPRTPDPPNPKSKKTR